MTGAAGGKDGATEIGYVHPLRGRGRPARAVSTPRSPAALMRNNANGDVCMAQNRNARIHAWVAEAKKNPKEWQAANDAARGVREAAHTMRDAVGAAVVADYLASLADSFRNLERSFRRIDTKSTRIGRGSIDAMLAESGLMAALRKRPRLNGARFSIAAFARWLHTNDPRWLNTDPDSIRRYLTRLKEKMPHEAPLEPLALGEHPNLLSALAAQAGARRK